MLNNSIKSPSDVRRGDVGIAPYHRYGEMVGHLTPDLNHFMYVLQPSNAEYRHQMPSVVRWGDVGIAPYHRYGGNGGSSYT